jgi:hypothetical protein
MAFRGPKAQGDRHQKSSVCASQRDSEHRIRGAGFVKRGTAHGVETADAGYATRNTGFGRGRTTAARAEVPLPRRPNAGAAVTKEVIYM